jgi:tetratricopeptide (TPR) repeat protein
MIADGRLERLERLPIAIHNQEALQTAEVGWALIGHAVEARTGDPAVVLALAVAAEAVADHLPDTAAHELRLRAQAEQGNALRIQGEMPKARRLLGKVVRQAEEEGEGLPAGLRAEIYSCHGFLLQDDLHFGEACTAHFRALELARQSPALADEIKVYLSTALAHAERFREAIRYLTPALKRLQEESPQRPRVLAAAYVTSVQLFAAWSSAPGVGPTRQHLMLERADLALGTARSYLDAQGFDRWRLSLEWGVALCNLDAGRHQIAGPMLDQVLDAYLRRGDSVSAAAVAVDLGQAYLAGGELAAVRELAASCLPIFQAAELPGDTLRTFDLLRKAEERRVARRNFRRHNKRSSRQG